MNLKKKLAAVTLAAAAALPVGVVAQTAAAPVASVAEAHGGLGLNHGWASNRDDREHFRVQHASGHVQWLGPGQSPNHAHDIDINRIIVTAGWRYRADIYTDGRYQRTVTVGASYETSLYIYNRDSAIVTNIWYAG